MNSKMSPLLAITSVLVAVLHGTEARADQFIGSMRIACVADDLNSQNFQTATSFNLLQPTILTETGVFTGVPLLTPPSMNAVNFDPSLLAPFSLWSYKVGATTYAFQITSVTPTFNSQLNQWDFSGSGVATVSGYTPTPAMWKLELTPNDSTTVFDFVTTPESALTSAPVPEKSTFTLMGGGLLAAGAFFRKAF